MEYLKSQNAIVTDVNLRKPQQPWPAALFERQRRTLRRVMKVAPPDKYQNVAPTIMVDWSGAITPPSSETMPPSRTTLSMGFGRST